MYIWPLDIVIYYEKQRDSDPSHTGPFFMVPLNLTRRHSIFEHLFNLPLSKHFYIGVTISVVIYM